MSIVFQCSPVERRPRLDRETYCNQCGEIIFAKARALRVVTLDCEPYAGFAWYYICNPCEWAWPPERERTPPRRSTLGHDHRATWRGARAAEHRRLS